MNDATQKPEADDKAKATPPAKAAPPAKDSELKVSALPETLDALNALIDARVAETLKACLPDMVKAALPPTPEAVAAAEAKSAEERAAEDSTRARKAREREDKKAEKAAADAAKIERGKMNDAAAVFTSMMSKPRQAVTADDLGGDDLTVMVAFDDGGRFSLDDPITISASELQIDRAARRVLINRDITIDGDANALLITGATLMIANGKTKKFIHAQLGTTLPVGRGRSAKLPAGSLAFAIASAADAVPADAEG